MLPSVLLSYRVRDSLGTALAVALVVLQLLVQFWVWVQVVLAVSWVLRRLIPFAGLEFLWWLV